jgi:hypothetical protein
MRPIYGLKARQFLARALTVDKLIKAKREQIVYLRNIKDDETGLGDTDEMNMLIAEYRETLNELVSTKRQISNIIKLVEPADLRYILELRYENMMPDREIMAEAYLSRAGLSEKFTKAFFVVDQLLQIERDDAAAQ